MTLEMAAVGALVSALLAIFIFIVFGRFRRMVSSDSLNKYRSKDIGLVDLLNYASVVENGIIANKNGSLSAAWIYRGPDNASASDEMRNDTSFKINQALAAMGNGWMIHIDAVRRKSPSYPNASDSNFPDWITRAIDDERRDMFESDGALYMSYYVITITWLPEKINEQKFVEMMFDDDSEKIEGKARTQSLLKRFRQEAQNFENRLSSALDMQRLQAHEVVTEEGKTIMQDDLLAWLNTCLTGDHHPINLPSCPTYIDALIGGKEMWGGVIPKIGDKYIQVVAIDGFPFDSSAGILSSLSDLTCEHRWSSRYIFIDQHEAMAHMEKYRKQWKQKVRGVYDQLFNTSGGVVDQDALAMVEDAETALAEISSGLVGTGYYTSGVILYSRSRTELELNAEKVRKAINRLGFAARVESLNTLDAFFGSMPAHGVENIRRPMMNTMNLADLLPVSSTWGGEQTAPCPYYPKGSPALLQAFTNGQTAFSLNVHVDDVGHFFVFGPTGSGKSYLLNLITAQLRRYPDMRVYFFDKGRSSYPLISAAGGEFYEISAEGNSALAFCPLQYLETQSDRTWACEWIETILSLNAIKVSPSQRNEIANAIKSMHRSHSKTLTEFVNSVQDEDIREGLTQYVQGGQMGHLLDAESDSMGLGMLMGFEISELMELSDKYRLPVLLYLFRRIERSMDGRAGAIILDEAWVMLGHDVFKDKFRTWLKTLRRDNFIVGMATQNLADATSSGILDVINESTPTKIFLPNPHAEQEDASELYKSFGLNNRQISMISHATPKRHYYLSSTEGRRMFEVGTGPIQKLILGASSKKELNAIGSLEKEYGNDWAAHWLANNGVKIKGVNV